MLARRRYLADLGPHGQPMSEATDPLADPAKWEGWSYEANERPRIDFAAKALGDAQDAFYKANPKASRNGHIWYLTKKSREG